VLNASVVFCVAGGCVKGDPQGWTHEESKKMLAAWASLLFLAMWVRNATSGPLSFRIGEYCLPLLKSCKAHHHLWPVSLVGPHAERCNL